MLDRLGLPFETHSPEIDESPIPGENAFELVARLSYQKSEAVSSRHPEAVVIGCDQVAAFRDDIIGKPGTRKNAARQLARFNGKAIRFLSALSVNCQANGFSERATIETLVRFRELSADEIDRYLDRERPFDCAGSFKSERAGITLLESMQSDDPTAIIGLPLISLSSILRAAGYQLP